MISKKDNSANLIIGDLCINSIEGSVSRDGNIIPLPKLSYLLLLELTNKSPAIVSGTELIEKVWRGKVVGEETVHQRVKLLRQAIGDCADTPKYIANVRGQGYKIIATVAQVKQIPPLPQERADDSKKSKWLKDKPWSENLKGVINLTSKLIALLILIFSLILTITSQQQEKTLNMTPQNFIADLSDNPKANDFYRRALKSIKYMTQHDKEENFDRIIIFLKNAIEAQPDFALAHSKLAQVYAHKVKAFNADDTIQKLALDSAERAIFLAKQQGDKFIALASAYAVKKMPEEQLDAYLNSIKSNPDDYDSYVATAHIYRNKQAYNKALSFYYNAMKIDPEPAMSYIFIGAILDKIDQIELAEKWLLEAIKRAPENNSLRLGLCRIYLKMDENYNAITMCESMLNWDWAPDDEVNALEWAAEAALNANLLDKAIAYSKRAMELDSNYSKFRYASLIINTQPELAKELLQESHEKMLAYVEDTTDGGDLANLSEYYAATGNKELTYLWLEKAIALGFGDYRSIKNNSTYQPMKNEVRFKKIISQLQQKSHEQLLKIDPVLLKSPESVLVSIY